MTLKRLMFFLILTLYPSAGFASSVTGKVSILFSRSDNLQYVYIDGQPSARPSCAPSTTYYMIKDENSAGGQGQYAMLLSAQLAGKTVLVEGTGSCTRWSDGEDIFLVRILY